MKHNLEHYVSILLGCIWMLTLIIGSAALFGWVIKALLRVIGVI